MTRGEKRNRQRMAQVAATYIIQPFIRDAQDVLRESRPVHEVSERRPKPTHKRVWASVVRDPTDVIEEAFREAERLDPEHRLDWVALVEGAKAHAFCIATDATGAPMRAAGKCERWDVFVFLADRDHVVFRYVEVHATSDKFKALLAGFRGHLLADAAPIHDALYETGDVIEHCCWFHCRRYSRRTLETDKALALGPLSLIARPASSQLDAVARRASRQDAWTKPACASVSKRFASRVKRSPRPMPGRTEPPFFAV